MKRILLIMLPILIGCSSGLPGSGTIDGVDLGLPMGLHLQNLAPASTPPNLAPAKALFTIPPPGLDSLRFYTARAETEEDGVLDLMIALWPLDESWEGGYLLVAVDAEGKVQRCRIWGNSTFDEDPNGGWENFWRQFERGRSALNPNATLPDSLVDDYWAALQADSTAEAQGTRLLYTHLQLMQSNSYLVRHSMYKTGQGEVPSPDWYRARIEDFARIEGMAEDLKPFIGEAAAGQYAEIAADGQVLLEPVVEASQAGEAGRVRDMISVNFYRRTCRGCHAVESENLGGDTIYGGLQGEMPRLGVTRDLYRIGYDLWAVPEDPIRSQALANAVKASLLVMGGR